MSIENLLALTVFAFVTSVSPGPSNVMLMTSGANFGFGRTLPQVLGITVGFTLLLLGVGLGLGALFQAWPLLSVALKIGGAAYLLYLAWRIALSRSISASQASTRPLTFMESALFQWINPKAWIVALASVAVYVDATAPWASLAWMCLVFALVNLPSVSLWAGFGVALRGFLAQPGRLKWFNIAMGALLALTLWPMLR
ncbi:LysE family translocator [Achromobacter sp.]|uniref:LysE family translocator n=1 Tax=Achromobacter sp. TaxID=134375 RepID=UPI003C73725B